MTSSETNPARRTAEPPTTPTGGGPEHHPGTPAWELLLPAVSAPARARGRSLQAALRAAVRSGRLAPGTRLPSSRDLAADLGVSRGLVTEAYEQLTAEGYLRSGRGAGTWVGGAVRAARPGTRDLAPRSADARADFVPGTPDVSLFPRAAWAAAQRGVLAELPHHELGYPDPRGLPRLRTALAELLARRRGVVADPERIVVVSGVSQATTVLGFVLHARGMREVGVEDPGSPQHDALYAAAGVSTVPLPMDDEGLAVGPLRESGVRSVVTTPAHQFPTGIAYSARRRTELLDWARSVDGYVLEDDYDGDFRYDRAPVGALQGLDPERVAYAGSVSKSLAPGLRPGWLLVPEPLTEEVVERKRTMDLGHPTLDQALFARFLERGDYDRQLRRCQRAYRERRDALVGALEEHFPGAEVSGIAAGLHVIAALPERYGPQDRFLARVAAAGVAVRPVTDYTHARAGEIGHPGVRLVLGYAHLSPTRIRAGVRLMAEAVATRPG
ncbi:PLP-dependent aminotransferase family protein [Streptomyces cyaneochromogenes]|uniref:PLP-dependent aminotransferase family protein n=1 Tax=Streptomyces cyaneochromogenes TaxID=2496836 RepID=A0A3Q9EPK6_9ACTN|nr:PLP-dependent aminotransferase family protein [Streptomyces cyaneochromogenes]AZQ33209.1 PLP-dependent aminotransferase family protein [Streptomyces cyaneochromogenes]